MKTNTILHGDAWELAKTLPDESINCIVTSPPYYGLRDYGTAQWEGGDAECDHSVSSGGPSQLEGASQRGRSDVAKGDCPRCGARRVDSQFGLEATPEEFVAKLVVLFRELRRALRHDGVVFLNLGDSYNGSGGAGGDYAAGGLKDGQPKYPGRNVSGLKPKDLIGIPWRVAFALQADGWYLRSEIIWHKRAPMPESVTDRPTKAHEQVFLLAKSPKYFYDAAAICEPYKDNSLRRIQSGWGGDNVRGYPGGKQNNMDRYMGTEQGQAAAQRGANKRSVWTLGPESYSGAHFAVMPSKLVEPCILAGCPQGGVVLDPFMGSGTVAAVAKDLGRDWLGFELNADYITLAYDRIDAVQPPLFVGAR